MNTLHIFFLGYGHIAPKTPIAKIVTIFYAILGIPLTVLCWSNIGDAMANSFRFCYWRICCYVCTKKPKKRKRRATSRGRGYNIFSNQYLYIYTNNSLFMTIIMFDIFSGICFFSHMLI